MGHLVRSLEFARALSNHDVTLIAGGQQVEIDIPGHVCLIRLPVLYMDETFTNMISGDPKRSVEQIQKDRQEILFELFDQKKPNLFIVELFPFGRSMFGFELQPLLKAIRNGQFGKIKTICSLRDILVEKKHQAAYEERVLQKLNTYFDGLLVHSDAHLLRLDETFTRAGDIQIPVIHAGFITQQTDPTRGVNLREKLGVAAEEKLIVASAGGGRAGFKLLSNVIEACRKLARTFALKLEVFAGPFMMEGEFNKLCALSTPDLRVRRYSKHFLDFLYAADLSVSLAGYNTCMNLLVTKVPALVYPYSRQQEQPMRAEKIKNFIPMRILGENDVHPDMLCKHIEQMFQMTRADSPLSLNLNGADTAASILDRWINDSII
jgi:predicted glycosyltransferase